MTKDFILKKLSQVEKTKAQTLANYNALCGAEQAYNEMLAELEKKETRDDCQEVKNE